VFADQPELFAAQRLPGFRQTEAIVTPTEERALIASIDAVELSPFRFHQWTGKRLTASFGWRYDFDDASIRPADPIPGWLSPLRARAAQFAGLDADQLVQASLLRYDPGAGIGWHRDRPVFGHVVGLSLGAATALRFRRRRSDGFDRVAMPLAPRSLYHLSGVARHDWEHSIAPMPATRWSIIFRSLAEGKKARSSS
jgi:alkylated DNA repair dioxygenase AlkB